MMDQVDAARVFRELHQDGLLILPNAWDAASARLIEHAGAKAIATSSAAIAWAHGYPDGEAIPPEVMLTAVREIVRAVRIPVSADFEAGYSSDPAAAAAMVGRVIEAGAVGINIEDGAAPPDLLAAKIDGIRHATASSGIDLWINARTDVFLRRLLEGEAAYDEAVSRARRYRDAGASSIFVPAVADRTLIARLVADVDLPLNVLALPGVPPAAVLREIGVRRLSAGSGIAKVLLGQAYNMATAFLADGSGEPFRAGAFGNPELNQMMRRS